ncbi:MAG TPA: antitoxin [Pseudonocardiaceae bacterium]
MKLSVSLAEADVVFLDSYAARQGVQSRSAALARAVSLLREAELTECYAAAFDEDPGGELATWERAAGDGLD